MVSADDPMLPSGASLVPSTPHTDGGEKQGRLVRDDAAHWYFIPHDKRAEFDAWVSDMERMGVSKRGGFDQYRLEMHPSNYVFTLVSEDE